MRILFYVPDIGQHYGGTRQYAAALLEILAKDTSNEYFILNNNNDDVIAKILSRNSNLTHISPKSGRERKIEKFLSDATRVLNLVLWRIRKKYRLPVYHFARRIVRKYKIDVVHVPYQYIPYTKAKTICTIHDVQNLHFPEYFSLRERVERELIIDDAQSRANHIIVSYQHIQNDLRRYYNTCIEKIDIVLLDMGNLWLDKYKNANLTDLNINSVPAEKYLLYPANTWPHKNHRALIEAVNYIRENHGIEIKIVCTGNKTEHFNSDLLPLLQRLNLLDNFIFTGIVDEDNLFALYKNSSGVVVPTTYEAGSFPLIESMLLHIPVICSRVTSLPETINNPLFTFDPFNIPELSIQVLRLWTDQTFAQQSIDNSMAQEHRLRNETTLPLIRKIYGELMASTDRDR